MTIKELNDKYVGRPIDMKKWRFSGMAPMGCLALAANGVELDDGNFYDFNVIIEMFDRVGVNLPPEAHSLPYMFNGRKRDTWKRLLPKKRVALARDPSRGDNDLK